MFGESNATSSTVRVLYAGLVGQRRRQLAEAHKYSLELSDTVSGEKPVSITPDALSLSVASLSNVSAVDTSLSGSTWSLVADISVTGAKANQFSITVSEDDLVKTAQQLKVAVDNKALLDPRVTLPDGSAPTSAADFDKLLDVSKKLVVIASTGATLTATAVPSTTITMAVEFEAPSTEQGLSEGAVIALIVASAVVGVVLTAVIVFFVVRILRNREAKKFGMELSEFERDRHNRVHPTLQTAKGPSQRHHVVYHHVKPLTPKVSINVTSVSDYKV